MTLPAAAPSRGGPTREVLSLALPAMLSGFTLMAYAWVNQAWVGRLPDAEAATAGASVGGYSLWALTALGLLFSTGAAAVVGRYVGAVRDGPARYVGAQALLWTAATGVVAAAAGVALAGPLLERTGVSDDAASAGASYVRIVWGASPFLLGQATCDAIWRGHGTTRPPLATSSLSVALNVALDPLLIFGAGPVPALGLPGAGVATAISSATATTVSLVWLARAGHLSTARPADDALRLDPRTPLARGRLPALDASVGRRLVVVGLPLTLNGVFFVGVYGFLTRVVTRAGGDAAQAGLWVGLRGEQVAWFVGVGFAHAAASLVARRLGAGRPDDAARMAWRSTGIASVACLAWTLALLLAPELLVRLFLGEGGEAARAHALDYWRVVALCLVPQCWEYVLEGAFSGAGMTVPPMVVTMALSATRVPLAHWAAFDLGHGVAGIWAVIAATAAARGVLIAAWFARGTWKHRTV